MFRSVDKERVDWDVLPTLEGIDSCRDLQTLMPGRAIVYGMPEAALGVVAEHPLSRRKTTSHRKSPAHTPPYLNVHPPLYLVAKRHCHSPNLMEVTQLPGYCPPQAVLPQN